MKTVIADALVVIRIPNFAGTLFGVILALPISITGQNSDGNSVCTGLASAD